MRNRPLHKAAFQVCHAHIIILVFSALIVYSDLCVFVCVKVAEVYAL